MQAGTIGASIKRGPSAAVPSVSVVIVHWNTPVLLRRCVRAAVAASKGLDAEIVVVDNGSDETASPPSLDYGNVSITYLGENRGFAAAANRGADISRGALTLFLNSDVELSQNSLAEMVDAIGDDPRLAALACCARREDGSVEVPALRFLTPGNQSAGLLGMRRTGRHPSVPAANGGGVLEVPWTTGSTFLVRSDAFRRLGGFDEGYYFYEEDEDFCWRLRRRGYRVGVATGVVVGDRGGASTALAGDWPKAELYRGQLRFVERRYGLGGKAAYRVAVSAALAAKWLRSALRGLSAERADHASVLRVLWMPKRRLVTRAA